MPIDALSVLCAQLTRDLLAIAKFLFFLLSAKATLDALHSVHTAVRHVWRNET